MLQPYFKKKKRNISKINQIMVLTGIDDVLEVERLLEKNDRQRKTEKRKYKKYKKKKYKSKKQVQNQPIYQIQQPQQISIGINVILPFIKLLLDKNLITKEELQSLTLNENNPLKQFNFNIDKNEILDKNECRQYWLYLMKHNELFCALCGHPITEKTNKGPWRLTAEHTIPRCQGGASDSTNLVPAHEICNNIKTNIMPEEWEKIGLDILKSYGIHVDIKHSMYKYIKEIQK